LTSFRGLTGLLGCATGVSRCRRAISSRADAPRPQQVGRKAFFFAQQPEKQVLGSNVFVGEALGLFRPVGRHPFGLVAQGQVDRGRRLLADDGVFLHPLSDGLDRRVGAQKPVGQPFVFTEYRQPKMLGLDARRAELGGFLPGKKDHPARFFGVALFRCIART